jgi:hypothetical protein
MKIDLAKSGYRTFGAVELFLVNLNDNGISERLVSGG